MGSGDCLLCYSPDSQKLTGKCTFFGTSGYLLQEISEVFVVRNILGISKSYCSKLIQNEGSPSSWGITYCSTCTNLIEEAQFISERVQHFQQKLNKLSSKIQLRLLQKIGQNNGNHSAKSTESNNRTTAEDIRLQFSKEFEKTAHLSGRTHSPTARGTKFGSTATPVNDLNKPCSRNETSAENENVQISGDFETVEVKVENSVEFIPDEEEIYNEQNCDENEMKEDDGNAGFVSGSETEEEGDSSDYEPSRSTVSRMSGNRRCNSNIRRTTVISDEPLKTVETDKIVLVNKSKCVDPKNISDLDAEKRLQLFQEVVVANRNNLPKDDFVVAAHDSKLRCEICKHTFRTKVSLEAHEKRVHFGIVKSFECKICNRGFRNRWELESHLKTHLPNQNYLYCPECSRCRFTSEIKRDAHVQKVHRGVKKPYKCPECSRDFTRAVLLEIHLKNVHNIVLTEPLVSEEHKEKYRKMKESGWRKNKSSIRIRCTEAECKRSFESELGLNAHIRSFHQGEKHPYACSMCPATFARLPTFQYHLKSHENKKPIEHKEEKTSKQKIDTVNVKEEKEKVDRDKKLDTNNQKKPVSAKSKPENPIVYKCDQCDKTFVKKAFLLAHLKTSIHLEGPKPFMCEICCKTFVDKYYLSNHQRLMHYEVLGLDPIICKECGKVYSQQRHLQWHIKSKHTNDVKFKCTMCSMGYKYENLLEEHIRTHTGEKPFLCSVCGKGFAVAFRLTHHMRIHTGEKPYQCDTCERKFSDHSSYRKHLEVHKGILHSCPLCPKQFPIRNNLRMHMKTHDKTRPKKKRIRKSRSKKNSKVSDYESESNSSKSSADPENLQNNSQSIPQEPKNNISSSKVEIEETGTNFLQL